MKERNKITFFVFFSLVIFDLALWWLIIFPPYPSSFEAYFLDIGQGDSILLFFPNKVKMLIDGGPDYRIVQQLAKIVPSSDKYIDLVFITHPQKDHFGGIPYVLSRYEIGAVIINGRLTDDEKWRTLVEDIKKREIPLIALGAGDEIHYQEQRLEIISPDLNWLESGSLNDSSIVMKIIDPYFSILLGGDIGWDLERYLSSKYSLKADILKVPHHGSRYSTSLSFLEEVRPKVAVVSVGQENRYGHPSQEVLQRLKSQNIIILRTDKQGTIKARYDASKQQLIISNFKL